ncbi:MAG TPA: Ig-like domain-containing protein, partial [Verrucomicrobiae bacterium]|nr:Ig-like domain-containing protein [Verrucomicrobiae bacterium]
MLVKNHEGVYGVTYRWGDSQTDAGLVPEMGLQESFDISEGGTVRTQVWHYPARYECLSCHTPSAGYALGFGTAQLNRRCEDPGGSENQIRALSAQGYFSAPVADVAGLRALANATNTHYPLEYRVRSYWAANCSQCHNPGGVETVKWDARITTPLKEAGVLDVFPVFNLGAIGTLDNGVVVVGTGSTENRIIKPNRPTNSVLLTRLLTPIGVRMPPLGSTILDHASIQLLSNWIQTLPSFPWDHHDLAGSGFEGSASISGGVFTVAGSRRDLDMEGGLDVIPILDLGHYLHRRLGASGRVTARVAAARSEAESSSGLAGLMVREDLSEFSPGAAVWLAPDGRAKFERRTDWGAVAVASSLSDTAGFSWIRLSREADRIRGLASSDGSHWVLIGEDKLVLSAQARMGFSAVALPPATFFEAVLEDVSVLHIAITNPAPHTLFVQPTTVPLKAHLEALGSSVERVEFHSGTNQLGDAEHPPYLLEWTNAPVGAHSIVARAIDADGTSIDSLPVPIVVSGPTPSALLLTSNATTKGVWKNVFGRDGTIIVGDSTNLPSYAAVQVGGARTVVWSPATVDGRALERVRGLLRVAAAWEADREFAIDLNLVDGRLHRLGLYFLDWNANFSSLRSQTVEVMDATRGTVLDRQTLPNSSGGVYLVWQLRGHVRIR